MGGEALIPASLQDLGQHEFRHGVQQGLRLKRFRDPGYGAGGSPASVVSMITGVNL